MSKIEQVIAELEDYIENCRLQPLSNTKIVATRSELEEFVDELKANVPDEVKKYQRIIANRDAILKDAQDKAEEMIKKANEMTVQLVSEHEIMQKAYHEASVLLDNANAQANEIMGSAVAESNALRTATNQYLDESLANIQEILSTSIDGLNSRYEGLMRLLQSSLEVAVRDRRAYRENQRAVEAQEVQAGRAIDAVYAREPDYDGVNNDMSIEEALNQTSFDGNAFDRDDLTLI
ncbi:MAG: hypothetical protein ACOX75_02645 [Lachnospiraceae bacterium]|jgi:cell division septum initiation protein DivIVA